MKKNGFTLAEVLVALGIIGVISALMIPAIGKLQPDKTKPLYLKAYDSLNEAVKSFVNDTSLYSAVYTKRNAKEKTNQNCSLIQNSPHSGTCAVYDYYTIPYNIENYSLLDFEAPVKSEYANSKYSGNLKFANLLIAALNGKNSKCDTVSCTFKTKNNIEWTVIPSSNAKTLAGQSTTNVTSVEYYNQVTMKINDQQFEFLILSDGDVIPTDIKGQAYIKHRTDAKFKESDLDNLSQKTIASCPKYKLTIGTDIVEGSKTQTGQGEEWDDNTTSSSNNTGINNGSSGTGTGQVVSGDGDSGSSNNNSSSNSSDVQVGSESATGGMGHSGNGNEFTLN